MARSTPIERFVRRYGVFVGFGIIGVIGVTVIVIEASLPFILVIGDEARKFFQELDSNDVVMALVILLVAWQWVVVKAFKLLCEQLETTEDDTRKALEDFAYEMRQLNLTLNKTKKM